MSGFRTTTNLLTLLFFALFGSEIRAQHPVWQHFGIQEGLPSKDVYAMMQDHRGYLWLGTKQGICRYNGYQFTRPVDSSAVANSEALYIVEDALGQIWFNRLDGHLWIIENDSVRAWPYNHLLKPFFKSYTTYRFAVGKDGTVWLSSWNNGILIVQPDGSHRIVSGQDRNALLFTEIDGQFLCASEFDEDPLADFQYRIRTGQTHEVFQWEEGKEVALGRFPIDYNIKSEGHRFSIWPLSQGRLINCLETYYLLIGNQIHWYGQKAGITKAIVEDKDGAILMAMQDGPNAGLLRFRSLEHFKRNAFENLLPGKPVTQVVCDVEGGWWVSTSSLGIYYCKNPKIAVFDQSNGLPSTAVHTLCSDGQNRIFAGMQQLDIAVFERNGGPPRLLPKAPIVELQTLRFDTLNGRLWAANNLCVFEKGHWVVPKRADQSETIYQEISVKKISPDISGTRWWASSSRGIILIDLNKPSAYANPLNVLLGTRTYSVNSDPENTLWITTMEGLRLWQDGQLITPSFKHPALRFNVHNVEFLPPGVGGGQVMALVSSGLLIQDQKGQFTHLTTKEGLTADMINELDVSPEGIIYACSNMGLNILRHAKDGTWSIETLSIKHGLPSNQVNDVALLGDEVWIATDGGLVRFQGKSAPAPMPAPILEKFVVNNRSLTFFENLQLPHDQNNLSLRFFSLHFRSSGDIPYRYRLLGADTAFVYTHTREVNFANLAYGQYQFEVQAQNEDGAWSKSSRWAFTIRPPWWATWWFRMLVAAALAAAIYLFYQNRLQAIRREAMEREKIRELENAALRAQMNPHFIFNCLQAIQSFIAQNDRDAAATYLARFAKLVRLALHGSVDGLHTLAEEISMLDNYLHLEQLRFRGKFEFSVRAEEGLEVSEISLPPLLVQPFVENALIHGLQNREKGGFVDVVFASKGNCLQVSVSDNGQGFSEKNTLEQTAHKSVGMMLTQKRLDLLMGTEKLGSEHFVRETVLGEDGTPIGARVQILIPM
jgi:ligand-binding sensor domain-containing protein